MGERVEEINNVVVMYACPLLLIANEGQMNK